jgi:hypothetical protein
MQSGARRSAPRSMLFRVLSRVFVLLGLFLVSLSQPIFLIAVQAQPFIPQIALGSALVSPEKLGMAADAAPPDLDEPEIGEDPETAPFATPESQKTDSGPKAANAARPVFQGQNHDTAAPLPLGQRLRRVLRASPLGGGEDFWFTRVKRPRDVYFLAFESGAHDRFLAFGSKHAVRGTLDAPGWRFLSTLGIKVSAYDPTLGQRTSRIDLARMMPGYEMRLGSLTLSAYAGLGYARSDTTGILATGRFGRYGVSALAEFWQDWSRIAPDFGRFTAGYLMVESANHSGGVGLRHGFALRALPFLVGPEASWSAGRNIHARGATLHSAYRKQRLGLHASEIPLLAARLRVSAGAEWREGRKPGGYAEMAAHLAY